MNWQHMTTKGLWKGMTNRRRNVKYGIIFNSTFKLNSITQIDLTWPTEKDKSEAVYTEAPVSSNSASHTQKNGQPGGIYLLRPVVFFCYLGLGFVAL